MIIIIINNTNNNNYNNNCWLPTDTLPLVSTNISPLTNILTSLNT